MLVIEIEIHPGGDSSQSRCIERLYVGNVSNLADVSDYAVYDKDPRRGTPPMPTATVAGHRRDDGAVALAAKVCQAVHEARLKASSMTAPRETEYMAGYNAGHVDGQACGRDAENRYRAKWLAERVEVNRLRVENAELRRSLVRLLSPDSPVKANRHEVHEVDEKGEHDEGENLGHLTLVAGAAGGGQS